MNITRSVILDLWPLHVAGEASADTKTLIEEFLRDVQEFAELLRREPLANVEVPVVPPDVEMRAFARARRRLGGYRSLLFLAMFFSCSAFGRIISDTSFDVSPRPFIAVASLAA